MELTFKRLNSVAELAALRATLQNERKEKDTHRVRVCCGTACQASGSNKLVKKFEEEAAAKGVNLEIVKTGCQGFCQRGPVDDPGTAGDLLPEGEGGRYSRPVLRFRAAGRSLPEAALSRGSACRAECGHAGHPVL